MGCVPRVTRARPYHHGYLRRRDDRRRPRGDRRAGRSPDQPARARATTSESRTPRPPTTSETSGPPHFDRSARFRAARRVPAISGRRRRIRRRRRRLRALRVRAPGPLRGDVPTRALPHRRRRHRQEARTRTAAILYGSASEVADAAGGDQHKAAVAGWALVHGIATLWRDGNIPPQFHDPVTLAEEITPYLFQRSTNTRRPRQGEGHR